MANQVTEETNESCEIFLITIFDKSEDATIKKEMLLKILKAAGL